MAGLRTAIEEALEHRGELQTTTSEAREHVVRNFDERVTASVLRRTYEAVLGRESSARKLAPIAEFR